MARLEIKVGAEQHDPGELRTMGLALAEIAELVTLLNDDDMLGYSTDTIDDAYDTTLVWTIYSHNETNEPMIAFLARIGPLAKYITALTEGDSEEEMARFEAFPIADIF